MQKIVKGILIHGPDVGCTCYAAHAFESKHRFRADQTAGEITRFQSDVGTDTSFITRILQ